jgi:hypothetical protein
MYNIIKEFKKGVFMLKSEIIDLVISQIKKDILDQEIAALEILLENLSLEDLKAYLPEEISGF